MGPATLSYIPPQQADLSRALDTGCLPCFQQAAQSQNRLSQYTAQSYFGTEEAEEKERRAIKHHSGQDLGSQWSPTRGMSWPSERAIFRPEYRQLYFVITKQKSRTMEGCSKGRHQRHAGHRHQAQGLFAQHVYTTVYDTEPWSPLRAWNPLEA